MGREIDEMRGAVEGRAVRDHGGTHLSEVDILLRFAIEFGWLSEQQRRIVLMFLCGDPDGDELAPKTPETRGNLSAIADQLGLEPQTVHEHWTTAARKIGAWFEQKGFF